MPNSLKWRSKSFSLTGCSFKDEDVKETTSWQLGHITTVASFQKFEANYIVYICLRVKLKSKLLTQLLNRKRGGKKQFYLRFPRFFKKFSHIWPFSKLHFCLFLVFFGLDLIQIPKVGKVQNSFRSFLKGHPVFELMNPALNYANIENWLGILLLYDLRDI